MHSASIHKRQRGEVCKWCYFGTNSQFLKPMFNAQCVNSQKAEWRLCRRRMKLVFAVSLECFSFVREGKNWRQSSFLVFLNKFRTPSHVLNAKCVNSKKKERRLCQSSIKSSFVISCSFRIWHLTWQRQMQLILFLNKFTIPQTNVQCTVRQFTKGREEKSVSVAHEACFCRCFRMLQFCERRKESKAINWRLFLNKIKIPEPNVQCTVRQFTKGREETVSAAHEACFCHMTQLDLICDVTKLETNLIENHFWTNSKMPRPNVQCTVRQFTKGREETVSAAHEAWSCHMQFKFDFWFYKSR